MSLLGTHFRERGTSGSMNLVERLRSGDSSALQTFVENTQQQAYRLAFSILQDPHQVQDVLQDSYLTVLEKIHQLRDEASLKSWFSQIVVNRCRQVAGQESARQRHRLDCLARTPLWGTAPIPLEQERRSPPLPQGNPRPAVDHPCLRPGGRRLARPRRHPPHPAGQNPAVGRCPDRRRGGHPRTDAGHLQQRRLRAIQLVTDPRSA